MLSQSEQSSRHGRIGSEALSAIYEPDVKLIFLKLQITQQLGMIPLWIINEKTGVNFEELRE